MVLKRRKRADERGAALFIVVLIVVLLSAVGTFAAHATSLTQTAAGYSRRSASTFYLSEFGLNVVTAAMSGKEDSFDMLASSLRYDCRANVGLTSGSKASCYPIEFNSIKTNMLDSSIVADTDGAVFGALSRPDRPADQTLRGSIRVEMTDVGDAPDAIAGSAMNGPGAFSVRRAALTTTSVLMPTVAVADCTDDVSRAAETVSIRGWIVYPMSAQAKTESAIQ